MQAVNSDLPESLSHIASNVARFSNAVRLVEALVETSTRKDAQVKAVSNFTRFDDGDDGLTLTAPLGSLAIGVQAADAMLLRRVGDRRNSG